MDRHGFMLGIVHALSFHFFFVGVVATKEHGLLR